MSILIRGQEAGKTLEAVGGIEGSSPAADGIGHDGVKGAPNP